MWLLIRPLLPYLLAAAALAGGWWYVDSLRSSNEALRADLGARNVELQRAYANIRQRIDYERRQRDIDAESARLARVARDRVPATVVRLRDYAASVPAVAANITDCARDSQPAESAAPIAGPDRSGEIYAACAATDAALEVLRAEVLRLDRELAQHGMGPTP